jgi:hypothetical protein
MRGAGHRPVPDLSGPLVAAAGLARDFSVRVVLSRAPQPVLEAEAAAEQAGVDIAVEPGLASAPVHFVASHQDRQLAAGALASGTLRSILRPVPAGPSAGAAARQFDPEPGATPPPALVDHVCGGMPRLTLNDVGGLVGLLRRRARERGVALPINPDVCACG